MSVPVLSLYFTLYETYENKKNITEFFALPRSEDFENFCQSPFQTIQKKKIKIKATIIEKIKKKTLNTNN